ncbi:MAG: hypothetical protein WCG84_04465 [Candidatus Moraniibacteriota bacterium]
MAIITIIIIQTPHVSAGLPPVDWNNLKGENIQKQIGTSSTPFDSPINKTLQAIITFLGWVTNVAASLLSWTLDPQLLYGVMQDKLIYAWWSMVRDVLNIFFIGVLLLSAFSTIFGIDKYHYKNILRQLIIMALLVNFSFPIARFVIDVADRLMYFLMTLSGVANSGLDTFNVFGNTFLKNSEIITAIVEPAQSGGEDLAVLLATVVFLFLFATALLTLAILLVIRVIALILIVIFSPVGFVGRIVPGMEGMASSWWKNLFRYAFFGPAALFMLTLSVAMMTSLSFNASALKSTIQSANSGNASVSVAMAGHLAMAVIPIILIYFTIGLGSKMSIKFADKAEKFGRWGTNALVGAMSLGAVPYMKTQARNAKAAWDASRKQVVADRARRSFGTKAGAGAAALPDRAAANKDSKFAWRRDAARREETRNELKITDDMKRLEEQNVATAELLDKATKGDDAAARLLAKNGSIDNDTTFKKLIDTDKLNAKTIAQVVDKATADAVSDKGTLQKTMQKLGKTNDVTSAKKLIGKSEKAMKKMDYDEYQAIQDTFKNSGGVIDVDVQKAVKWKAKDSGHARFLIRDAAVERAKAAGMPVTNPNAVTIEMADYQKALDDSSQKDVIKQIAGLKDDPTYMNYVVSRHGGGAPNRKLQSKMADAASDTALTPAEIANLRGRGLIA